mgnify:CR=1 FL=1
MMDLDDRDDAVEQTAPVWAVFGDLMSGLLGAFVLILVGMLVVQMDLVSSLKQEVEKRQQEEQRRMALEHALAGPLASGRVTLNDGRIGISGSVLFAAGSDELRPDGRQLLKSLVEPLRVYLGERQEMLMVSGFTDDTLLRDGNRRFTDNLELSAQRALTVTRALIDEEPYQQCDADKDADGTVCRAFIGLEHGDLLCLFAGIVPVRTAKVAARCGVCL